MVKTITTDMATVPTHAVAIPSVGGNAMPSAAVVTIADWARELDAAYQIAQKLVTTSFAPRHFQGKPADAAAAILTGHELGLTPMASLRSIFMISGTPGLYAKVMVAIAQSRGHQVWVAEQSDERVVVKGRRRGEAEVYETVWDRARVIKAKLQSNAKYQENPQQMMVARGQAEIARQVAADALHGVPYSVEELEDLPPIQATATVTAARLLAPAAHGVAAGAQPVTESGTASRFESGPVAGTQTEGPVIDIGDAPIVDPPTPQSITAPQSKKLHALLGETGRGDRDEGLRYLTLLLGREVDTTKTLTRQDAMTAIDDLQRQVDTGEFGPSGEPEQLELEP